MILRYGRDWKGIWAKGGKEIKEWKGYSKRRNR
jgi:hypothetical protein